jgi:hypothetical protein
MRGVRSKRDVSSLCEVGSYHSLWGLLTLKCRYFILVAASPPIRVAYRATLICRALHRAPRYPYRAIHRMRPTYHMVRYGFCRALTTRRALHRASRFFWARYSASGATPRISDMSGATPRISVSYRALHRVSWFSYRALYRVRPTYYMVSSGLCRALHRASRICRARYSASGATPRSSDLSGATPRVSVSYRALHRAASESLGYAPSPAVPWYSPGATHNPGCYS